jgi:hypothetical protein
LQTTAVGTSSNSALNVRFRDSILPRRGSAWTLVPMVVPSAAQKALLWKMIEDAFEMVVVVVAVDMVELWDFVFCLYFIAKTDRR